MADYKKNLYNISLANQGYLLYGIPQKPARKMENASIIGTHPTTIDLEYKDSSIFIPWAQTDWAGGFQFEKWTDNAGFKSGSGLEYILKYGELTLLNNISSTVKEIGAGYTFGASCIYNKTLLIGTKHATLATLGYLDDADIWTAITTGWTNINYVNDMDECMGKVFIALKRTTGTEKCLQSWDGSALADATGDATDSSEWRMVVRIEDRIYASNFDSTANGDRLLYSDNSGTSWTIIITKTGANRQITQGVDNFGTLYFLIEDFPRTELWWCNDTTVTQIYRWENLTNSKISMWLGKVYVEGKENGKLRKFEWNGAVLKTVFEEKIDNLDIDASPMVIYKNNQYSYGLIFDGVYHFPSYIFKYGSNKIYPFVVFGGITAQVPYFYGLDGTSLKITKLNTAAYLTTGNTITGKFNGQKPAVKKLWHSVDITFKALVSGQNLKVYYSTDDEATWTLIGTADTVGSRTATFYFPSNTTSKRIQIKIELNAGGSDTPTFYDFVVRYFYLAEEKYQWTLTLNCSDNLILLDGKTREPKRAVELRNLLMLTDIQNDIVEFQDVDFAETLLNGALTASATTITVYSTAEFPEQGRIKIEQEEILYTGKTATTFTGCTRGARGTLVAAHTNNTVASNSYKVLVQDVAEANQVAPKAKVEESLVSVSLLEV